MLMERLDIPKSAFEKKKKDLSYIDEILEKEYVSSKLLNHFRKHGNYQTVIINFAYAIFNKEDTRKAEEIHADLIKYYHFFEDDEIAFYVHCIMYLNLLNEQYYNLIDYYEDIKILYDNNYLRAKSKMILIKGLHRLEKFGEVLFYFKLLKDDLLKYLKKEEIETLFELELTIFARYNSLEKVERELEAFKTYDVNREYIYFTYYFHNEKNILKAYEYISEIKYENTYFYTLYLICLDKLNKKEELKTALEDDSVSYAKLSEQYLANYLKEKHFEKEFSDELKKDIKDLHELTSEIYIIRYVFEDLIVSLKEKFLYKEALYFQEILTNEYKERASIMIYS